MRGRGKRVYGWETESVKREKERKRGKEERAEKEEEGEGGGVPEMEEVWFDFKVVLIVERLVEV